MKKIISIILLVMNIWSIEGQIINIPDANFKNKLLLANNANFTAMNNQSQSIVIDSNSNGEIEQSEALQAYYLILVNTNINDLSGIEFFTNVKWLNVNDNNLTTINLSQLTNLETFACPENQLTTIDFSNNPNLKKVLLNNNLFTTIDFSNNPLFNQMDCSNNPNLTTIKINNNNLHLFGPPSDFNQCWLNLPNLTTICADSFEVANLQSFLVSCGITQPITINTSCALDNDVFEISNISIYPNPSNGLFTIDFGNSVDTANLIIYNMLGQEVYSENIKNATNKTINLEHLSKGTYVLKYVENFKVESRKII